jgi:peptide/nickel transport system substrate-binding protein
MQQGNNDPGRSRILLGGRELTRRSFVKNAVALGVIAPSLAGLLVACEDDDADDSVAVQPDDDSDDTDVEPDDDDEEVVEDEDDTDDEEAADDDAPAEQDPSDTVTVAQGTDPTILDPHRFGGQPDNNIMYHIFDQLVWRGDDLEIEPELAESWEIIDDLTWEFHLREGVEFHNGEPFNAEAVEFTVERAGNEDLNPTVRFRRDVPLDELEIIDDYTIRFVTERPHALMLDHLNELLIMAPEHYSEISDDDATRDAVGTGPFKLREWVRDDHLTLERNEDYWAGPPDIGTLVFRPIPESSSRIAELETGGVDVIVNVPPDQIDRVDSAEDTRIEPVQGGRRIFVGISLNYEFFQDVRVRQALNYAVDVDTIIDSLLGGYGERMRSIANEPWKNPDLDPYPYDPDRARELLAEAGYEDGLDIVMQAPDGRYTMDRDVAVAVASYLDEVGVRTEVEITEWSLYLEQLQARETEPLYFLGLGAWFNGQDELRSVQTDDTYASNNWVNDDFESGYAELTQTFDEDERRELSYELQRIVFEDCPWIFMYKQYDLYGVSERLDWQPRADERMYFNLATIRR